MYVCLYSTITQTNYLLLLSWGWVQYVHPGLPQWWWYWQQNTPLAVQGQSSMFIVQCCGVVATNHKADVEVCDFPPQPFYSLWALNSTTWPHLNKQTDMNFHIISLANNRCSRNTSPKAAVVVDTYLSCSFPYLFRNTQVPSLCNPSCICRYLYIHLPLQILSYRQAWYIHYWSVHFITI